MKKLLRIGLTVLLSLSFLVGCVSPMKQYEAFIEENEIDDLIDDLIDESEELKELIAESEIDYLSQYIYDIAYYESADEFIGDAGIDEIVEKCDDITLIIEEINELMALMEIEDEEVAELNDELLEGIDGYRGMVDNTLLYTNDIYVSVDELHSVMAELQNSDGSMDLASIPDEMLEGFSSPMVKYKLFVEENSVLEVLGYIENEKEDLNIMIDDRSFSDIELFSDDFDDYSSADDLISELNIQPIIEKCESIIGYSEDVENAMATLAINDEEVVALNDKLLEAVEGNIELSESVIVLMRDFEYLCLEFYSIQTLMNTSQESVDAISDEISVQYANQLLANQATIQAMSEALSEIDMDSLQTGEETDIDPINVQKQIIIDGIAVIEGFETYNEADVIYNDGFIGVFTACVYTIDVLIEMLYTSLFDITTEYEDFDDYYETVDGTLEELIGQWEDGCESVDVVGQMVEASAVELEAYAVILREQSPISIEDTNEIMEEWEDDYKDID